MNIIEILKKFKSMQQVLKGLSAEIMTQSNYFEEKKEYIPKNKHMSHHKCLIRKKVPCGIFTQFFSL